MAKILARRMNIPVYVGCSMRLPGLVIEEEMDSLTDLTKAIMDRWSRDVRS
jgi:hypothetical protein